MQGLVPGVAAALIASGRVSQADYWDFTRPAQVAAFTRSVLSWPRRNDDGRRVMGVVEMQRESARRRMAGKRAWVGKEETNQSRNVADVSSWPAGASP